jgi:hypothetical protein
MTYWAEVTAIDDIERVFVSADGTNQRRTQPFEEVSYSGDWRVEFMPIRARHDDGAILAVAMSLVAVVISATVILTRLLA